MEAHAEFRKSAIIFEPKAQVREGPRLMQQPVDFGPWDPAAPIRRLLLCD
jgi:hypothetical protein